MATIAFPSNIIPDAITWGLRSNTQVYTSPLNGVIQTAELPGTRWVGTMSFSNLDVAEARILISFLAELRGSSGRFYIHDFTHPEPQGTATGTPINLTSGSTTTTIKSSGWTASTLILKRGDYVQFHNYELKLITSDVTSTAGGLADLPIEPPLRGTLTNSQTITTSEPQCLMLLDSDDQARWDSQGNSFQDNLAISFVEAF